jgi:hypothetical protein
MENRFDELTDSQKKTINQVINSIASHRNNGADKITNAVLIAALDAASHSKQELDFLQRWKLAND